MFKKLLICTLIWSSILAMEEEKPSKSSEEKAFNALIAATLNKFPEDKQKEIQKYLSLGEMPSEIKTLIAMALVDSVDIGYSKPFDPVPLHTLLFKPVRLTRTKKKLSNSLKTGINTKPLSTKRDLI